jgi:hypothetical protein
MKTKLVVLLLLLLSYPVLAQDETLLDEPIDNGGFGGPAIQFTPVNDKLGILVGGGGGWIIGHTIVIGGFGYGLANEVPGRQITSDSSLLLNFGYGGVYLAYIHNSGSLLHFSVNTLIGGGSVDYRRQSDGGNYEFSNNDPNSRSDAFFVLEPGINLELNVAKNFRIALGANYRFISEIDLAGMSNSRLSGPAANLIFKFGSF